PTRARSRDVDRDLCEAARTPELIDAGVSAGWRACDGQLSGAWIGDGRRAPNVRERPIVCETGIRDEAELVTVRRRGAPLDLVGSRIWVRGLADEVVYVAVDLSIGHTHKPSRTQVRVTVKR